MNSTRKAPKSQDVVFCEIQPGIVGVKLFQMKVGNSRTAMHRFNPIMDERAFDDPFIRTWERAFPKEKNAALKSSEPQWAYVAIASDLGSRIQDQHHAQMIFIFVAVAQAVESFNVRAAFFNCFFRQRARHSRR